MESNDFIDLTDLFTKDGEVFKVQGIAETPTVTLENIRDGSTVHLVIGSPLFQEYVRYSMRYAKVRK